MYLNLLNLQFIYLFSHPGSAVDTLQITIALTSGVNFFHFCCAESTGTFTGIPCLLTMPTMLTLMFNLYMFPQKSLISCLIITLVLVTLKYYTLIV